MASLVGLTFTRREILPEFLAEWGTEWGALYCFDGVQGWNCLATPAGNTV
jgi:hypothetical protein